MTFKLTTRRLLPREKCYEYWAKQRKSIYEIPHILADEFGIVNDQGKPFTPQAVWRAASLYMLDNIATTRNDTVSVMIQQGEEFNEEKFAKEMLSKARQFYTRKGYREFLLKNVDIARYAV